MTVPKFEPEKRNWKTITGKGSGIGRIQGICSTVFAITAQFLHLTTLQSLDIKGCTQSTITAAVLRHLN